MVKCSMNQGTNLILMTLLVRHFLDICVVVNYFSFDDGSISYDKILVILFTVVNQRI